MKTFLVIEVSSSVLIPVLQVVLGGLEDPGVGGVGTLDVRATEESHLHGHPPQSHLTLRVLFTNTGLKVLVEPGVGWRVVTPSSTWTRVELSWSRLVHLEVENFPGCAGASSLMP